jgi:quercetin dioxygenase-like cupin family protein
MKQLNQIYDETLPADIRDRLLTDIVPVMPDARAAGALRSRILSRLEATRGGCTRTVYADQGEWRPLLPKVQIKVLHRQGDSLSYLVRMEPGAVVPPHEHPADEECLVLEGEIEFGDIVAHAGDYHMAPKGVLHGQTRSSKGGLMFVRGAIGELAHFM